MTVELHSTQTPADDNRMYVYEKQMKEYNLSSYAIKEFAYIIQDGNMYKMQDFFKNLDKKQQKGLLGLVIDYMDLNPKSMSAPSFFGIGFELPEKFIKSKLMSKDNQSEESYRKLGEFLKNETEKYYKIIPYTGRDPILKGRVQIEEIKKEPESSPKDPDGQLVFGTEKKKERDL